MRILTAILSTSLLLGMGASAQADDLSVNLVYELSYLETYEGHVAHEGLLWTSESRTQESDDYRVHIFSPATGEKIKTLALPHSAEYLYAYGPGRVLAVGRTSAPWYTHYSILKTNGSQFSVESTTTFPEVYQVFRFAGDSRNLFFNEPGTRSIYQARGRRLSKLGSDVSLPMMMKWDDDAGKLWVVEGGNLGYGDENIVVIDKASGQTRRVFDHFRNGITNLELFQDLGWLVANEAEANNLLFISLQDETLKSSVQVAAHPRGLARFGRCVAVTSVVGQEVTFYALDKGQPEHVATWDVSAAGDRLKNPRNIAIDESTGKVFLRSAYPCGSCTVTQSSIFSFQDQGQVADRCL